MSAVGDENHVNIADQHDQLYTVRRTPIPNLSNFWILFWNNLLECFMIFDFLFGQLFLNLFLEIISLIIFIKNQYILMVA